MLTHGSLFSGIGGFDLGALWAGIPTLWQVEKNNYCRQVLQRHFPDARRYSDISEVKPNELEKVNIISGGFPCQPFSTSGKLLGQGDHRYLWPEMFAVIKGVRPGWVVIENVPNIINMAFDTLLSQLGSEAYQAGTFILPACGIDAPHRRDRLFVIAHTDRGGCERKSRREPGKELADLHFRLQTFFSSHPASQGFSIRPDQTCRKEGETNEFERPHNHVADTNSQRLEVPFERQQPVQQEFRGISETHSHSDRPGFPGPVYPGGISETSSEEAKQRYEPGRICSNQWSHWDIEPRVGRVAHGIPNRVQRITALGNAVVPQLAWLIFSTIKMIEEL
jgi:DNA (cytosine-5)-methyltransferase 1